ncbi:leucine rich repeat family protein [Paenibacillus amylolyticus]|uniref:Leucine rich repeat family protein n=1 Tax=Paenibacillus amylolyticus TaxID=1451 RepID=A0A117I1A4_PAEAM|nr:leucine rich repeat family protein [Paenibacillus amylolyticus]
MVSTAFEDDPCPCEEQSCSLVVSVIISDKHLKLITICLSNFKEMGFLQLKEAHFAQYLISDDIEEYAFN